MSVRAQVGREDRAAAFAPPPLTPRVSGELAGLLSQSELLHTLVDAFGSPLNIVLPQQLTRAAANFRTALDRYPMAHRLFVAHKPNRSAAMIRQAAVDGLDLDVASSGELANGLVAGFPGARMEATGPKNRAFLRLALQHDLLIQVDNEEELRQLVALHGDLGRRHPADVALRIAVPATARGSDTRFGVSPALAEEVIDGIAGSQRSLRLSGLAFHLTSGGVRERVAAFELLIELYVHALRRGLVPTALNVGGGFGVQPLADPDAWPVYTAALKAGLLGEGPPLTWNDEGFGLRVQEGRVVGSALLPALARRDAGALELEEFLTAQTRGRGRSTVADAVTDHGLQLQCEPGRSMYDQCGLTLAKVTFVKRSPRGAWLVGLDANRTALNVPDREVFLDPVVLPATHGPGAAAMVAGQGGEAVGVHLVGNLCHPADLLARHLVRMATLPAPGDVLAFPNTASYVMDFAESATLLHRTAPKVAAARRGGPHPLNPARRRPPRPTSRASPAARPGRPRSQRPRRPRPHVLQHRVDDLRDMSLLTEAP